jgi:pimeloyl-ACP methyl ester carboxylesterase
MAPTHDDPPAFDADSPAPLPPADAEGYVEHEGARIWYAVHGAGAPVILLHGGFGNGEDWGNQVPALTRSGRRVILIDSRGQGRSTRDDRPFSYTLMAADVLAVMDALAIERAALVGASDGAIIGLTLAMQSPARLTRVFAYGGNMDLSGVKPVSPSDPVVARVFGRAARDYARLSPTPSEFAALSQAVVRMMMTQPNYAAADLAAIRVPVAIAYGEHDEFITREHTEYLARTIPGAQLIIFAGVGHFAPLHQPAPFNDAMLAFLRAE